MVIQEKKKINRDQLPTEYVNDSLRVNIFAFITGNQKQGRGRDAEVWE